MPKKTSKAVQHAQKAKRPVKRQPPPTTTQPDTPAVQAPLSQQSAAGPGTFQWPAKPVKPTKAQGTAPALYSAEEYRFVRSDLLRTVWLSVAMFAILIAFWVFLR